VVAELLSTFLSALVATNSAGAISNVVETATGISVNVAQVSDPVERDYLKLLEMDDAAQAEVDRWIKENNEFKSQGAGVESITVNTRIEKRFAPVKKAYEEYKEAKTERERRLISERIERELRDLELRRAAARDKR
jgi:ABC-type Na+ efflux pump permease subunit